MQALPFSGLRAFKKLFATYCDCWEPLAPFYQADWRAEDSYRRLAPRVASPIDDVLAQALRSQNARWNNAVEEQIGQLQSPRALAIVTGQQVGIFGGPLYTVYKALTAVQLARRLTATLQRPVVPVFWLEGGDHDLVEVAALSVPAGGQTWPLGYEGHTQPRTGNLGSVGRLPLSADIDRVREALRERLATTEFTDQVLEGYFGSYREGVSFTDAFARSLARLCAQEPLVLVNPEDRRIKPLCAPLFEQALLDHEGALAQVQRASARLATAYHVQVTPRATNLFYQGASGREALRPHGDGFVTQHSARPCTAACVVDRIRAEPFRFSPNVALRPLVQDRLLPTLAYVAGPAEVAYFGQLKGLYAWAGLEMPVVYPRASVTLLEPAVQRILRRHDLGVADLQEDMERLLQHIALRDSHLATALLQAEGALEDIAEALRPEIVQADATLSHSLDATSANWRKALDRLGRRAMRAQKRKFTEVRAQLVRARQSVLPDGKPQERMVPTVYCLNKYGPSLMDFLREHLSLDTSAHQVLPLQVHSSGRPPSAR